MGEKGTDRARMVQELDNLPQHPESVPINMLVQVEGTPLHGTDRLDALEFVRTIAAAHGEAERAGQFVLLHEGRMLASGMPQDIMATIPGSVRDVAPDGFPHPVYRYGFPVSIPIPLRVAS